MVFFLTVALAVSIVGMIVMLWLKRYELTTGRVVFSRVRPGVGVFLSSLLLWIEKILPALARRQLARGAHALRTFAQYSVAHSVLAFERGLEKILHTVREKTAPQHQAGEASAFLREVAKHKKNLLKKRTTRNIEE